MGKVFVDVIAEFTKEGELRPISFIWNDGTRYNIDKVYEYKKAASLKAGGHGIRYKCKVMGKDIFLYLEEDRWFIEGK